MSRAGRRAGTRRGRPRSSGTRNGGSAASAPRTPVRPEPGRTPPGSAACVLRVVSRCAPCRAAHPFWVIAVTVETYRPVSYRRDLFVVHDRHCSPRRATAVTGWERGGAVMGYGHFRGDVGGRAYVLVRLRPGAEVSAFPARCPHRLVPLSAATAVDGRLTCPYHGWQYDGEGRCVSLPSLGPDGTAPPRADLPVPWAVEERHGWVWLAPERTAVPTPPRPAADTAPEPGPAPPSPSGPVLGNLDSALDSAWHPVALSSELRPGGWLQVRLLGRTWSLRRTDRLEVDPPAYGVRERLGVVWLAPAAPRDVPLEFPEDADRRFVTGWLPPQRSAGTAGVLADVLLDVSHAPFLHAATSGAADHPEVPGYDVEPEPGGFRSAQEQWFDAVTDPGVATGERPLRQRRRGAHRP